jgi:serine/threonine protein kinase
MSPEGMIDHLYGMKTDIWAFGIIVYELLHGKTPFSFCTSEN